MTYATVTDLKTRIPARDLQLLSDHDGPADEVVDSKLEDALQDATAQINGFIAKVVSLPLSDAPAMLNVVCRDLAVHRLHANLGNVPDAQQKLADAALEWLKSVAEGKISIGDETGGDEVQTSEGAATIEGAGRVMTRDSLRGF